MNRTITAVALASVALLAGSTAAVAHPDPDGPLVDHVDHVRIYIDGVGEVTQERIYPTAAGRDFYRVSNSSVWVAAKALHPELGGDNEYIQFVCNRLNGGYRVSWDVEPGRVELPYEPLVDRGCDNPAWYPDATAR